MLIRSCFKVNDISAKLSRSLFLSSRHNHWKETYESYIKFPNLISSQQNALKAADEYKEAKRSREQRLGSLLAEQNHLRDIHSEMDMIPSFESGYSFLLQKEMEALKNIHANLFDLQQHDRVDHQKYLKFCATLQENFDIEHVSEKKSRRVFFLAIFTGVTCGFLLSFLLFWTVNQLHQKHTGDQLISSYAFSSNVTGLKNWINLQHSKTSAFLLDLSNQLKIEASEDTKGSRDLENELAMLSQRNKHTNETMIRVMETIQRENMPVLEIKRGGRGEKGLWTTTLTYSCIAVLVPLVAFFTS